MIHVISQEECGRLSFGSYACCLGWLKGKAQMPLLEVDSMFLPGTGDSLGGCQGTSINLSYHTVYIYIE